MSFTADTTCPFLPPELKAEVSQHLDIAQLLTVAATGFIGCQLSDNELWARLFLVLSPFFSFNVHALYNFFDFLDQTGAAIMGYAALHVIVFGTPAVFEMARSYTTIEIAVNVNSFAAAVDTFRTLGYVDFKIVWTKDWGAPGCMTNTMARATGYLAVVSHCILSNSWTFKNPLLP
jgi:hypothetical protein